MANLTKRNGWKRWAPNIGENHALPDDERLYFELATGLTTAQLEAMHARISNNGFVEGDGVDVVKEKVRRAYSDALSEHVRIIGGPHTIDSRPLVTFEDYASIVQDAADGGLSALIDVVAAVRRFNSFGGPDELFSLRRSGGSAGTPAPSAAKEGEKTAAP